MTFDYQFRCDSPDTQISLMSFQPSVSPPTPPQATPLPTHPSIPLLRELFAPICYPWITDFLFAPGPLHTPHLTNTEAVSTNSITKTVSDLRLETSPPLSPTSPSTESCFLHGRALYLPTVSISASTIGFGAMNAIFTSGAFISNHFSPPAKHLRSPFRFTHHSGTYSLLEVHDLPAQNRIVLYLTRPECTLRVRTLKARFNRTGLLSLIDAMFTSPPTEAFFGGAAQALESLEVEVRSRACVECGAESGSSCGCVVTGGRAAGHPFDTEGFREAMRRETGVYAGVSTRVRYGEEGASGGRATVLRCVGHGAVEEGAGAAWVGEVGRMETAEVAEAGAGGEEWGAARREIERLTGGAVRLEGAAEAQGGVEERKRELRKQRNRESALRSHLRKKERRARVERELEREKRRVEVLRERETQLRRENMRLRGLFLTGGEGEGEVEETERIAFEGGERS